MNPWTASFEEHRQNILGEAKKKSDKKSSDRWQDDDGDNKWYEKSDVDGKISDREKKEKKNNVKENKNCCKKCGSYEHTTAECTVKEDITLTKGDYASRNVEGSAWDIASKKNFEGYIAGGGLTSDFQLDEKISASGYARAKKWREEQAREKDRKEQEHFRKKAQTHKWDGEKWNKKESVEVNHIDGSKTEIVDVITRPAMVAAPKLSNWKEEMQWQDEALKPEKLDVKETGVKNKIQINPEIKTESKKQKYDNTKSPDYEEKKETLAKKHGGADKVKGHPQYEHHQKDANGNTIPHDIDEDVQSIVKKVLDRGTKFVNQNPVGKALGNVVKPWNSSDGGSNRKSATAASQKAKGLSVGEQVEIEEKKKLSNGSPLINRVSKWSKTMKKEEVISERGSVKYYKGDDRNPNTGLPKGLRATTVRTEKEVSKKLDRTTLAQSYEPEGEVVSEGPSDKSDARTKRDWKGPGAPGLNAHKERIRKHKERRGKKKVNEIFGKELSNYLGKDNIKKNVQVQPGQKDFVKSMPDPTVVRDGKTVVKGGPTVSRWTQNNIKAMRGLNNSYEPQGEQLDENPLRNIKDTIVNSIKGIDVIKKAIENPGTGLNPNTRKALELNKKLNNEGKKKKDDTYLEPNWEKRKKNNEKARKDLQKGPQMKNPHLESIEVVVELNRYGKETGKATGSINKRPGSKLKKGGDEPSALRNVRGMIRRETGKPEGQRKKNKGEKGRQQPGDRRGKPADTIARRRQSRKDADAAMRDTRGT